MQVYKGLEERAIDIISDMLLSSRYEQAAVESERDVILREEQEVMGDAKELILENVHYTAFQDHIMQLPILGNKESIKTIQREDLKQFILTHYLGPRMVVVGVGPVDHSKLVDLAEKYLGQLPTNTETEITGEDQPRFTGSQMQTKEEHLDMAHIGVFYPAPSWRHKDYFAFLVLQRLLGEFDPKKEGFANLPPLQYNPLHRFLGERSVLGKHECLYLPYKDCGLMGSFISTPDVDSEMPPMLALLNMHNAAQSITEADLCRARNKIYTELLNTEAGEEVSQTIASQLIYMGRIIPRSEIAARVASLDAKYLQQVYATWLDVPPAVAWHGPQSMADRDYEVFKQRL
jgi:processing peptidase subunit beta